MSRQCHFPLMSLRSFDLPSLRFLLFVLFLLCLLSLLYVLNTGSSDEMCEQWKAMDQRLSLLNLQMDSLRVLDKERSRASVELRDRILHLASINQSAEFRSATRQILFGNLSLSIGDLSPPTIYDHLPHLLTRSSISLAPILRLNSIKFARNGVFLVIGIPTIKREKVQYLMTTLRSLIDNLSPDDQQYVVFVVMIADVHGLESIFVQEQVANLQAEFHAQIHTGLLEVMVPPPSWYPPDLDSLSSTFSDSPERMYWRTKQNLDYVYLMLYCANRGQYYLQLEDDVVTKPAYLTKIRDFLHQQASSSWLMLEFSSLGFIGKLFRTVDLPLFSEFFLMFHREKPVDWLLYLVFSAKFCHPEKSIKQCSKTVKQHWIRMKPPLFQHIGLQSSLEGKVQKLKEKDFGKIPLFIAHKNNPDANVSTSLIVYQKYALNDAYKGDTFFWALEPHSGDWIQFDFTKPIKLKGFTFRSGNRDHPMDMVFNGTVELKYHDDSRGFMPIAEFNSVGTAHLDNLSSVHFQVASLRLVFSSKSDNWVILSEIWIDSFPY